MNIKLNIKTISISFLFISLLFVQLSCSKNGNKIQQDKFIKVYTNLIIAQDSLGNKSAKLDSVREKIFESYNINHVQYENTIKYYNEDPKRWNEFFEKTIAYIETLKSKNHD